MMLSRYLASANQGVRCYRRYISWRVVIVYVRRVGCCLEQHSMGAWRLSLSPISYLFPPLHQYRLYPAARQHSPTGYRIAASLAHLVTMTPDSVVGQFMWPRAVRHWLQFIRCMRAMLCTQVCGFA